MTRRARQALMTFIAALFASMLVLFLTNRHLVQDPIAPRDLNGMARWIGEHPGDWLTASAISNAALDSNLPRRHELWRSAYALARHEIGRASCREREEIAGVGGS